MVKKKRKVEACIDPVKRDRYLYNKFGVGLDWYEKKQKEQKGLCAICHRPPKTLPLAIDHWHKLAKLKIKTEKYGKMWQAYNIEFDLYGYHMSEREITTRSRTRKGAVKILRLELKRRANRGLLCWACNSGLRKWLDNPKNLYAAAKYLERHQLGEK